MHVILLERVENLGSIGDVVTVKPGFARNYLLPQEKALRATEANKARFEREREIIEKRNAERRDAAADQSKHIDGNTYVLIRQAGETGHLYGSVNSRDIVDAVSTDALPITRSQVDLKEPIKTLGLTDVKIRLHAEVFVTVTINVARSEEEAERQAKGEDVIASQYDEDRAIADAQAAELFEASQEHSEDGAERASSDDEAEQAEETDED